MTPASYAATTADQPSPTTRLHSDWIRKGGSVMGDPHRRSTLTHQTNHFHASDEWLTGKPRWVRIARRGGVLDHADSHLGIQTMGSHDVEPSPQLPAISADGPRPFPTRPIVPDSNGNGKCETSPKAEESPIQPNAGSVLLHPYTGRRPTSCVTMKRRK